MVDHQQIIWMMWVWVTILVVIDSPLEGSLVLLTQEVKGFEEQYVKTKDLAGDGLIHRGYKRLPRLLCHLPSWLSYVLRRKRSNHFLV